MKDIDIVASMFEEIKKSLEKLSKQKPSSQPTAETLSEDIISLKKILKLIFDMQTKLYEAQQELPNALKQSITVKVQQPKYFWWLVHCRIFTVMFSFPEFLSMVSINIQMPHRILSMGHLWGRG